MTVQRGVLELVLLKCDGVPTHFQPLVVIRVLGGVWVRGGLTLQNQELYFAPICTLIEVNSKGLPILALLRIDSESILSKSGIGIKRASVDSLPLAANQKIAK